MNYEEAIALIKQTESMGSRMGLSRIQELLARLGNPEKKLQIIHVAGTNGKGSVCAMTAEILKAAGYQTGMFTSPELFGFETQFLVNGEPIPKEEVILLAEELQPHLDAMEDKPSEFEIITTMAFLSFLHHKCDYVILEVGMGGIDDATNVIPAPLAAVIVNIGLDHMQFLGETVEEIAMKKAGIIKPGCQVILADQPENILQVLKADCERKDCDYQCSDNRSLKTIYRDLEGQVISYHHGGACFDRLELSLLGTHQQKNAAIVLELMQLLCKKGAVITDHAINRGLKEVRWPGRFEILQREPLIVVDGAHNPHGVKALAENLKQYFPGEKLIFITGILADKDYEQMLALTMPFAAAYITVEPDNARALSAEACADVIRRSGMQIPILAAKEPMIAIEMALASAKETGRKICAFGSLYNVNELRKAVANQK